MIYKSTATCSCFRIFKNLSGSVFVVMFDVSKSASEIRTLMQICGFVYPFYNVSTYQYCILVLDSEQSLVNLFLIPYGKYTELSPAMLNVVDRMASLVPADFSLA